MQAITHLVLNFWMGISKDISIMYILRQAFNPSRSLVEETNDLARDVLASSLLVVHDTGAGG